MRQRSTYILIGVGNLLIGIGFIMLLLHGLKWPYIWATFVGNACGIVWSYLVHRPYMYHIQTFSVVVVGKIIGVYLFSHVVAFIVIHPWVYHAISIWAPDWDPKLHLDVVLFLEASVFTMLSIVLEKFILFPREVETYKQPTLVSPAAVPEQEV
ncbi:GtrA family protein [Paenibacillus sp. SC116]|uniref:GtrA family protein n=1 Tax=Paenibacillus sp. SC116 TaxID=2968986 RepID=UPI00215AD101|nr:GtrA family protein [Paenibacillus sp. SC116]MCR8846318.1 GtrA family protein [Paenibacillus sp. SC116]